MDRRTFVKQSLGALSTIGILKGSVVEGSSTEAIEEKQGKEKREKKPNILWIMTDQQFADAMSCAGCNDLKTPAMDRLAKYGVRFQKAYCSNPICIPSRCSMMTGLMPHQTGVTFNQNRFPLHGDSIGKVMKNAGYRTGYFGKWHITRPISEREWHGFEKISETKKNGKNDQVVVPQVIEFLSQESDDPFFLVASFQNPHDICEFARIASGYKDRLWNGDIGNPPAPEKCPELPTNFEIGSKEPSVIREHQRNAPKTYPVRDWSKGQWRQYRWAYYRMIEMVDRKIGKILDALESLGKQENTVVVFTSDHGDGVAAHRWNQKTLFYEETARVPLIISDGRRKNSNQVNYEHLVNTGLDLYATFCDYGGVPVSNQMLGMSLRGIVEGKPPQKWREFVVSQNDLYRVYGKSGEIYGRMLRSKRFKYVIYSEGKNREQFFDMERDSGELENLIGDPNFADMVKNHRTRLARWIKENDDWFAVAG